MPPDIDVANPKADAIEALSPEHKRFLIGVFTTAIEGGINYWARREHYHWHNAKPGEDMLEHEDLDGYYATIIDCEDIGDQDGEELVEKTYRIDAAAILRGVEIIVGARPPYYDPNVGKTQCADCLHLGKSTAEIVQRAYEKLDAGDIDASIADNIVQAGLFGSIVYG